jgi:hypothetical protein
MKKAATAFNPEMIADRPSSHSMNGLAIVIKQVMIRGGIIKQLYFHWHICVD